jgi:hypothetical protein
MGATRVSIVGLDTTHGFIYPAMFNGYDPARLVANSIPIVSGIFPTAGAPSVEGVRVVACYDEVPEYPGPSPPGGPRCGTRSACSR